MGLFTRKQRVTPAQLGLLLLQPAAQAATDQDNPASLVSLLKGYEVPGTDTIQVQVDLLVFTLQPLLLLARLHHTAHFPEIEKAARAGLAAYVAHNRPVNQTGIDWVKFNDRVLQRINQFNAARALLTPETSMQYGMQVTKLVFGEAEKDVRAFLLFPFILASMMKNMEAGIKAYEIRLKDDEDLGIDQLAQKWIAEYKIP